MGQTNFGEFPGSARVGSRADITASREESIYLPAIARLLKVEPMTELEKLFTLQLPEGRSLGNEPGQFVEVSLLGIGEAPISVSSSPSRSDSTFELCVRRVGDLTNALHALEPGDMVGVRGPYGHGFPLEKMKGKDILFAAGGLGLAPLRSVINQVLDERSDFGRVIILYGTRHPREILFKDELAEWAARGDVEFHMTVDRADEDWRGHVGVITTLFPEITVSPHNTVAATCGPPIMYRFVLMEMLSKGIPETQIYLSLERRMKCGVGKCGHCQINNLYCCQDGPVFAYAQIKGLGEAL
jgi:sulfhydrogenase subunit gamma (sulfur reductase)